MWVGATTDTVSERQFHIRLRFVMWLFSMASAIILLRLFFLQVVKGDVLAQLSQSNSTQLIFLRAPRGDFYDRTGRILVMNRPSWSILFSVPDKSPVTHQDVEARLAPFEKSFPSYWRKRLTKAFESRQMVRLVEDIPDRVAFGMRELGELVPGLHVLMEFRRGYPLGVVAGHLIGYLGEITEGEMQHPVWSQRKPGDMIGKMGLEKLHDETLRGQDGGMLIEVDSIGKLRRVLKELRSQKGNAIHLTVDYAAQKVAQDQLALTPTKRGAAVAMDVQTGAILVWASAPSFDPMQSMAQDLQDQNRPFFDRVYKGAYPPASIFKVITAAAAMEDGALNTAEIVTCPGYVLLKDKTGVDRKYKCWSRHGRVDFWEAMAQSCDTYFYLLGKKIGSEKIARMALKFGLGKAVQSTLPGEAPGNVPNANWKRKMRLGGWSTGDTFNMSIGQGFLTVTPLQMATLMSLIATRGHMGQPYAVQKIEDLSSRLLYAATPSVTEKLTLKDSTWESIRRSLGLVVESGTGAQSKIRYLDVSGKTGTAQNPHGEDHAWFSCYAGYKGEPAKVAVCVFVENGGHGGALAAPIAAEILRVLLPPPVVAG